MASSTKQDILSKLRTSRPKDSTRSPVPQPSSAPGAPFIDFGQFKQLLEQNHAEVHETTETELHEAITQWIEKSDITEHISVSEHPELLQLKQSLNASVELIDLPELDKNTLFNHVALSICYAELGIADKGALLVEASAYQPRTLSLVPPTNILVLHRYNILSDLSSAFASPRFSTNTLPRNIILISGPSKTADIQQTLAYGAHGPKQLVVFVIS